MHPSPCFHSNHRRCSRSADRIGNAIRYCNPGTESGFQYSRRIPSRSGGDIRNGTSLRTPLRQSQRHSAGAYPASTSTRGTAAAGAASHAINGFTFIIAFLYVSFHNTCRGPLIPWISSTGAAAASQLSECPPRKASWPFEFKQQPFPTIVRDDSRLREDSHLQGLLLLCFPNPVMTPHGRRCSKTEGKIPAPL